MERRCFYNNRNGMKQKEYIKPNISVDILQLTELIALSGGEQTEESVHNPDDEVDAGTALSRKSIWDDE